MVSSANRSPFLRLGFAVIACCLVLSACGGSDSSESPDTSDTPGTADAPPDDGAVAPASSVELPDAAELADTPFVGRRPFVLAAGPQQAVVVPSDGPFDTVTRYYDLDVAELTWTEHELQEPIQADAVSFAGGHLALLGLTCDGIGDGTDCGEDAIDASEAIVVDVDTATNTGRTTTVDGFGGVADLSFIGVSTVGSSPLFKIGGTEQRWATVSDTGQLVDAGASIQTRTICGVDDAIVTVSAERENGAVTGIRSALWNVVAGGIERNGVMVTHDLEFDAEPAGPQLAQTRCTDSGEPIIVGIDATGVIDPGSNEFGRVADVPPGVAPFHVEGSSSSDLYSVSSDGVVAQLVDGDWQKIEIAVLPDVEVDGGAVTTQPQRTLARAGDVVVLISTDRRVPGKPLTMLEVLSD